MEFVPADKQSLDSPCHHIPLNDRGDTVAKLAQTDNPEAMIEAIKIWLENTIQKLEQAQPAAE